MKRRFVLTPEAKSDLKEILVDIAEDSPATANRVRTEFYDSFTRLASSPGIGHFHEELLARKYRFWNFYSYVVVYAWEAKPIQIIRIVHGARDLSVLFAHRGGRKN
ncbi:MAG TPA: type II toxin-antitoxin system RelE/ParE family toxin [Bryobacteraceae bacterium]